MCFSLLIISSKLSETVHLRKTMLLRKQSFCPCWECFTRRLLWPDPWTQRAVAPLPVESNDHTTPPVAGLPQVPWWSHLQGHVSATHALWPYHLRNEGQPAGEVQLWRHLCQEVSPWVSLVSPFIARHLFLLCLLLRFSYPPLRDPWVPVFTSVSGRWGDGWPQVGSCVLSPAMVAQNIPWSDWHKPRAVGPFPCLALVLSRCL